MSVEHIPINPACRAQLIPGKGWACDCEFKHPLPCAEAAHAGKRQAAGHAGYLYKVEGEAFWRYATHFSTVRPGEAYRELAVISEGVKE